jgi:hypothetical protein
MKIGAAKFAVGDRLQAHFLLHADHFTDGAILDCAQLRGVYLFACKLFARLEQISRAQETADVIGAGWNQ